MRGLIRKEISMLDKTSYLLAGMALLFSLIPSLSYYGSTCAIVLVFVLPVNSISHDEKSRWDRYAAMLPYGPERLVWSKYLLSYAFALLAGVILFGSAWLRDAIRPGCVDWLSISRLGMALLVMALVIPALVIPCLYRFGSERARLVMVLVMVLVMAAGGSVALGMMSLLEELPALSGYMLLTAAAVVSTLAVSATWLSFRLCVRFYIKRQNGVYD